MIYAMQIQAMKNIKYMSQIAMATTLMMMTAKVHSFDSYIEVCSCSILLSCLFFFFFQLLLDIFITAIIAIFIYNHYINQNGGFDG
jgi:hypothetical protein